MQAVLIRGLVVILTSFASGAAKPEPAVPVPTAAQLEWQKNEIMALIHFNMATFFRNGDP